ncbi:MAG: hypothetical protein R3A51_20065 [Nannocystaceae bacterium]|nr:hypothetical protein [Myxococcales bacterium]
MATRPWQWILSVTLALGLSSELRAAEPSGGSSDLERVTASMKEQPSAGPMRAKKASPGDGPLSTARGGCMTNPELCKCTYKEAADAKLCEPIIGFFCPESTVNLLASKCVTLFGGVTACRCASPGEVQTHLDAEEKAAKKKRGKGKKKAAKK